MSESGVNAYLEQMRNAAEDALSFVDGFSREDFLGDKRTQQAVVMSMIILGEAATRMMEKHEAFCAAHPQIEWRSMRGMRNRIAHGYFEIDFNVVWETVQSALPKLKMQLSCIAE